VPPDVQPPLFNSNPSLYGNVLIGIAHCASTKRGNKHPKLRRNKNLPIGWSIGYIEATKVGINFYKRYAFSLVNYYIKIKG
jgi:hypothetical protein